VESVPVDRLKPHLRSSPAEAASPPARGRPPKAALHWWQFRLCRHPRGGGGGGLNWGGPCSSLVREAREKKSVKSSSGNSGVILSMYIQSYLVLL
jgi:hypothetical protein